MNTRNQFYLATLLSLFLVCGVAKTYAQEEEFIEGGHYELLDEVQAVQTGDKIEVVEMFWYQCPHCFKLHPYLVEWLKNIPENAELVLTPALLSPRWEFSARAYYTFEALGVIEELHGKFYNAIHEQRLAVESVEALASWVVKNSTENELERQSIIATFDSFAVESKLNFARVMTQQYRISGVPAVIVDGRYRTNVSLAGGQEQLIKVINFLIEKAAQVRASIKAG